MDVWFENLKTAIAALRAHRLRTLLSALSVSIGAGAIALMVSLSNSGLATITAGVDAVGGRRLVYVSTREPKHTKAKIYDGGITMDDANALRARVPGVVDLAYMAAMRNETIVAGHKTVVDIAIGSSFRHYLLHEIAFGRDIAPDSAPAGAREVLLSEGVAKELFGSPGAAVSESILLWGHRYEVVGVTHGESKMGFEVGAVSKDRAVFVSAPVILHEEGIRPRAFMLMRDDGSVSHDLQIRIMNSILLQRHRGVDDFEFMDFERFMAQWDQIFLGLRVLTGIIAALSLFIAGAGIMNVLLASVRQRISEIGIRRALGATRADIRAQFVIEAMLLAGVGGVLGAAGGLGMAMALGFAGRAFVPGWENRVALDAGIIAIVFATITGLVFGYRPARKASRLDVVDALRGGV